ncbi:katna1, partial [Symbiodinium sp. CCMP2456]
DIVLAEDVDLPLVASQLERYSGADVQLVCREASMSPMRRLVDGLTPAELVQLRSEGKLDTSSLSVAMADFEAAIS